MLTQYEKHYAPSPYTENLVTQNNKSYPKLHSQYITSKPFTFGHGKGFKICSYYKKLVHMIELCFKKHGIHPYLKRMNLYQTIDDSINKMLYIILLPVELKMLLQTSLQTNRKRYWLSFYKFIVLNILLFINSTPMFLNHHILLKCITLFLYPTIMLGFYILRPQTMCAIQVTYSLI